MTHTALYDSSIGLISLTLDGEVLVGLRFGTSPSLGVLKSRCLEVSLRWLDFYFSGRQPDFMPPISLRGTDFQQRVWQALVEIPYGQTISYGELARRVGCRSAQAVGQAVGRNPIAIIVPCHRVVGSDGSLTGYAYGIEKKQFLLQLEKQHNPI